MMNAKVSSTFHKSDFIAISYEFLVLILPVFIYVYMEARHKHDWSYMFTSPEWGIATIFLCFQGAAFYTKSLTLRTDKRINSTFLNLIYLIVLIVTIGATLNSFDSLDSESNNKMKIMVRLVLLFFSIVFFFVLSFSGKKNEKK